MSTGDASDEVRAPSSSAHAGTALEADSTAAPAATESTGSTPSTSPDPATAPPAASSPPAATPEAAPDDDPVRDAIAKLARPDDQPRDEKGRFASAAEEVAAEIAAKVANGKKPVATAPKPAALVAKPTAPAKPAEQQVAGAKPTAGVDTDPYEGFDPRERDALKGKTRERIEMLHRKARDAETKLSELQAKPAEAHEFDRLLEEHKLRDDAGWVQPKALAGLISAEAAVTRSMVAMQQNRNPDQRDLARVGRFFAAIDGVREKLGFAPAQQPETPIVPLAGKLPDQLQEMIDVYGLPEADVRMLAAIRARAGGAAAAATPPAAPAAPVLAAPPAQQPRPSGVDMSVIYGQRLAADLTREGVEPDRMEAHFLALMPIAAQLTQEQFPSVPLANIPRVFDALPPKERYDIMLKAHRAHQANVTKARSRPPTPPPPASPPSHTGSAPRAATRSTTGDAVVDAVSFLAR